MKVLVLGGTGAMGVHLVENLTKNKIDTYVTTRSVKKSENNLYYLHGNAKDFEFIEKILSEYWDAIVDFMVYSTEEFKNRVNILLSATTQYVFLSSSRVYANSIHPLTENSPRLLDVSQDEEYLTTDEYALAKARQENILENSGKKNWTILRPYITYSENRLQLGVLEKEEWLYRAIKGRTIVFSKEIAVKKTTLTYGLDVSRCILALIGKQDALSNTFHITLKESDTWEEILKIYLLIIEKNIGFRPNVLYQNRRDFFETHPSKYKIVYDRMYDRKFDNSKLKKIVDTNNFIPIKIGLEKCLSEFLQNPNFKNINWKLEAIRDKQSNEMTPLTEIPGIKQRVKYILYRYFPVKIIELPKSIRK